MLIPIPERLHRKQIWKFSLSVVDYHCRSLERLRVRVDVPLLLDHTTRSMEDSSEPGRNEQTVVNEVVEEWLDLAAYLSKMNAPECDIASYRREALLALDPPALHS
mmetsp:Transcript_7964/g.15476  ORF Transcript_7964/g.15476 Transcript_7964/m.15476 type:complete len:106 (-) Transcript_7964:224-541(-)|eukprot:scaffold2804_cov181-Amphora_coffeaeformis.AAC.5